MKLKYNAPTTLTFSIICAIVLVLNLYIIPGIAGSLFTVPGKAGPAVRGFDMKAPMDYVTLVSYVIGHRDWAHLMGNFMLILLLGPILEQIYGSLRVLLMMAVTAIVGGVFNALLFPTGLQGASGIAFMMILLASFANSDRGEVPITFLLILVLYLGNEVLNSFNTSDGISHFAHIIGGACGSLFGFFKPVPKALPPAKASSPTK
jgi:membrane associated rhomboid family serine protease